MKQFSRVCLLLAVVCALAAAQNKGEPPDGDFSFSARQRRTIIAGIDLGLGHHPPMSNVRKVANEIIRAAKQATPQTITTATVLASRYEPRLPNGAVIWINWIEDHPTLGEAIVVNPETKQQVTLAIPAEARDKMAAAGEDKKGFIFIWLSKLPPGFVTGETQALEMRAPGQAFPATCYPSVPVPLDTTAPTTLQGERETGT